MKMQMCLLAFHMMDLLKSYSFFFFIGKIHLKNIYLPPSVEDIPFLVKALLFKLYEKSVIHFKFYFV